MEEDRDMTREDKCGTTVLVEIRAESREACTAEVCAYLTSYHPWGYGTAFGTPKQGADGQRAVSGTRRSSAD